MIKFNRKSIAFFLSFAIFLAVPSALLFSYLTPVKSQVQSADYSTYINYPQYQSYPQYASSPLTQEPLSDHQETTNDPQPENSNSFCLNVPILYYHHIQPYSEAARKGQTGLTVDSQVFDSQMAYLKSKEYVSISADELVNALKTHTVLPLKTIVITFDDGYMDNFTYAYPVLQKYGYKGNIMIATGLIGAPDMLDWNSLREMVNSGVFNAYNHTWSHVALASVSPDKIKFEVLTANKQLEENIGKKVNIFTYPYGSQTEKVAQILEENGFSGAFSTLPGNIQCESFIMSLHRTRVGSGSLSSYGI
ncbi:MAG: polysaccharide deacetylase family protein [Actinobacteria bacterium]|nr:polysaccharide deacetylase family protein [Actinomycetota bacterium]